MPHYEELAARQREMREGDDLAAHPARTAPRRPGDRASTGVAKSYGERKLFETSPSSCRPGGILGVVGPNGTGKTTLLKLITGRVQPDAGRGRLGETVELCYVDQMREELDPEKTVFEEISEGKEFLKLGTQEVNSRAYVARFNFRGPDQQKKVGECSGGQRNRVQLAKMLRRGGNVILLDEPTNDLDLDTLRVLEEAIQDFPGCAVVVSHDRYFLNRVATHILAFEDGGQVRFFEGDYTAYEARRQAERDAAGLGPESQSTRHRRLR